jgi:hypothetical protein
MLQNKNKKLSEEGNVVILILIAVFLFGALAFSFSNNARNGSTNISKQQAKIAAQEILNYARLIEGAVNRVRRNSCSENEITFENALLSGYSNTNAPPDKSCHVFDMSGGKLTYSPPNKTHWLDSEEAAFFGFGDYIINAKNGIKDIGNDGVSDLVLFLSYIKKSVCLEINNSISIQNPSNDPPQDIDIITHNKFIGDFAPAPISKIDDTLTASSLAGKSSGCVHETIGCSASDCYHFYHALLAR